jgi:hypothetical protein
VDKGRPTGEGCRLEGRHRGWWDYGVRDRQRDTEGARRVERGPATREVVKVLARRGDGEL